MFTTFWQRQACFMFFWQCYQYRSLFLPFGVKQFMSFELDDARFDFFCFHCFVLFGICRGKISPLLILWSSGTPWIRKFWLMLRFVFPFWTFCEALVLLVSMDFFLVITAAYVYSTSSQFIFIDLSTFRSTRSVNPFSMFFNSSSTSRVQSFSETLASALPRMKLSCSFSWTHLLHKSITFTVNSLMALMVAVDNAVHSGVRCIRQLEEKHMYVFSLLGLDFLQVLQFPMISVVNFFLLVRAKEPNH